MKQEIKFYNSIQLEQISKFLIFYAQENPIKRVVRIEKAHPFASIFLNLYQGPIGEDSLNHKLDNLNFNEAAPSKIQSYENEKPRVS